MLKQRLTIKNYNPARYLILLGFVLLLPFRVFSQQADTLNNTVDTLRTTLTDTLKAGITDTVVTPRIPVKKTVPETFEDLAKKSASDLRDPENLETKVEYDIRTGPI